MTERFGDYLEKVDAAAPAINALAFAGHATLRVSVMGSDYDRVARPDEIAKMQAMLAGALDDGAAGLSTGLFYPTAKRATTAEVIEIGRPLTAARALYATHMRDEGDGLLDSIDEALAIGRALGIRTIVSHLKCLGGRNFGRSLDALKKLDLARDSQPVAFDMYPYIAGSTILLEENVDDCARVLITWSDPEPAAAGRDLDDLAAEWGCDRVEATRRLQPGGAIYFKMSEDDVRRIVAHPQAMIGSDGLAGDPFPHPRLWGTFPRVLGHYVRELGLMPLEQAVHRMTGLPAANFGLTNRGRVAPGFAADLVLFDAAKIGDRATFDTPTLPAAGVHAVFVNGAQVWDGAAITGNRPGRMLRRQDLQ
jgi:N-acyl-D-amino-acid deacylase